MPTKDRVARHTRGPWQHAPLSDAIITARGVAVAEPPDGYDEEQWHADAKVIAAAPELLDALKAAYADLDAALHGRRPLINPIELSRLFSAAIAKAEGRS